MRRGRAVSFLLPPITSARDAADIAAAVAEAVASGKLTPSEAAEIGKVIDVYVRAYQTMRVEQMTDAELMHPERRRRAPAPRRQAGLMAAARPDLCASLVALSSPVDWKRSPPARI